MSNAKKMLMGAPSGIEPITDYTWTTRSAGSANWNAVAADASGNVVVVGNNGYMNTSSNGGVSWGTRFQVSTSGFREWQSVATDGNGTFVAGNNYGRIAYSSNYGSTWTSPSSPSSFGNIRDILWDGSRFILAHSYEAGGTTRLYSTTDGSSVSNLAYGFANGRNLYGAVWDGTNYLIGADAGRVYYTSDFSSWSYHSFGDGQQYKDISVSDDGIYVAVGGSGRVQTSTGDFTSWTLRSIPVGRDMESSKFAPEYNAFMIHAGGTGTQANALASAGNDGATWTTQSNGTNGTFKQAAFAGGDTWVAVGSSSLVQTGVPT